MKKLLIILPILLMLAWCSNIDNVDLYPSPCPLSMENCLKYNYTIENIKVIKLNDESWTILYLPPNKQ